MSDRDRRLAEMMGLCWHEWNKNGQHNMYKHCIKCRQEFPISKDNPDFSLPEWRAKLMDFCVEQEWWGDFLWSNWSAWAPTAKNVTRGDFVAYLWRNLGPLVLDYRRGNE